MEKERGSQAAHPAAMRLPRLVLASASPRRAEILRAVGWPFEAQAADVDETARAGEAPAAYVRRLAREKAATVASRLSSGLVLGADTVVVCEGEILGKPRDDSDARRMLRLLRGRRHEVLTGVALVRAQDARAEVGHAGTLVSFCEMTDGEIDWYVATGEPVDKAGAYAVQGRAALFIAGLEGDYWNVVGLPVRLAYELAARF